MSAADKPKLPDEAIAICKKFDKDKNGYISKSEVKQAVKESGFTGNLDELMKKADTNKDGKVDYNEFFAVFFSK